MVQNQLHFFGTPQGNIAKFLNFQNMDHFYKKNSLGAMKIKKVILLKFGLAYYINFDFWAWKLT